MGMSMSPSASALQLCMYNLGVIHHEKCISREFCS